MFTRRIKNVIGSGRRRSCGCGSWLEHFYTHGGTGDACVACGARAVLGAHVWVEQAVLFVFRWKKLGEHIVPLCTGCNKQQGWMEASVGFELVSANTQVMGCAVRRRRA